MVIAGKTGELLSIGYAFLYFYGLERRALIDNKDVFQVIIEVKRLLEEYNFSSSFNSYLHNFLAFAIASQLYVIKEEELKGFFGNFEGLTEEELNVVLAWYAHYQKPITWDIAFQICKNLSNIPYTIALKRIENELRNLFEIRFKLNF